MLPRNADKSVFFYQKLSARFDEHSRCLRLWKYKIISAEKALLVMSAYCTVDKSD